MSWLIDRHVYELVTMAREPPVQDFITLVMSFIWIHGCLCIVAISCLFLLLERVLPQRSHVINCMLMLASDIACVLCIYCSAVQRSAVVSFLFLDALSSKCAQALLVVGVYTAVLSCVHDCK